MQIKSIILLALISLLPGCWQKAPNSIVETQNVTEIYNYIKPDEYNKNTLVMFDIDNTSVAPKTDLGSDQWFDAMVEKYHKEGLSYQQAVDTVLPIYLQVLFVVPFYASEPETAIVIRELQQKGVSVIALTARSLDLAYRTVQQLHETGIYMTTTDPYECPIQYGSGKPAIYIEGVIFTGSYPKGEVIASWFKQTNYYPKKVIFLDDKLKNVKSVGEAMRKYNYPYVGLRYGFFDERKKQFNWDTTQRELEKFIKQHPESRPIPTS